jgi:hypothetical protein
MDGWISIFVRDLETWGYNRTGQVTRTPELELHSTFHILSYGFLFFRYQPIVVLVRGRIEPAITSQVQDQVCFSSGGGGGGSSSSSDDHPWLVGPRNRGLVE